MWSWLCCQGPSKQDDERTSRKMPTENLKMKKSQLETKIPQNNKIDPPIINRENDDQSKQQIVEKKNVYIGEELNGVPHGTGTKQYMNGDYYKGQWVNGLKEGKGQQYYFQLRSVYNGEWKHDLKNGNGHETEANGSWYEGEFKDGVRHGKGVYFDKQLNVKYSEIYTNGHLKQRKQISGQKQVLASDQFPTLKLDKQRFNTDDLIGFEEQNPQIKELDLDFLLKYYGLRKVINLEFIETPITEWTIKQVHLFLEEIGLQKYKSIFYDNKIKGKDLATLDEEQMKQDLQMKLGDRKILMNYIEYINSLNKNKKKEGLKSKKKETSKRSPLSIKKRKQSLLSSLTQSIEHEIIEEDDEWNLPQSGNEEERELKDDKIKQKNEYETEKWDKYISRDDLNVLNYHSHADMQIQNQEQTSDKTEKGSDVDRQRQIQVLSPSKRKRSEDKQVFNVNSLGGGTNNGLNKKEKSSSSSSTPEMAQDVEEDQLFRVKRKKTSVAGPNQQIRELYEFLRENQSLDFIIKQKDIQIIEVIGEGGYGKVYRGRYMQCPVAVKDYMKAGRSHKNREEFMKEVHILSDLKHPNIVLYMGLCITVNRYQLVTEFMENGSLYDQLHIKKTKFTKDQQLQIIDDIVQGMVYLHNMKNMLHRDLKSSNVLIAEDFKVKLCDFGLSGHRKSSKKQKKNRIGTYQWMAPEVIRNQELDFFSDVYSFGVIIWEILTQKVPYEGLSEAQIVGDVGYDKNHKLPAPPKDSDEFIVLIMNKCLQRDPSSRPTFIQIQQLIKEERNKRPPVKNVWNLQ